MHNNTLSSSATSTVPSRGAWLLLLLVCAFPLISVSVRSGGSTLYALLGLTGLVLGWRGARQAEPLLRFWFLALLGFFALGLLSLLYTADMKIGGEHAARLLRLASLGLVFGTMVRFRLEANKFFIVGLIAAALSMFVQAVYQTSWQHHEVAEGLYHKIIFGDMAMLIAVLLFVAALTLLRGRLQAAAVVAIVLALYASILSATRGAWLMVPVTFVVMAWLYRRQISRRLWLGLATTLVVLLVTMVAVQPERLVGPIERGVTELQTYLIDPTKPTSWGERLNMWRNATLIWWQHPLLGTGIGDFNHDSRLLVAQGRSLSDDILQYTHAHSIYFDTLATLGLVGLITMIVALFLLPGRYFYKAFRTAANREVKFAALAGLLTVISFAVFGLSEGWLARNPFVNPYIVYLSLFAATVARSRSAHAPS